MKDIYTFPPQYQRINEQVKAIHLPHALSKDEEDPTIPSELLASDEYRLADFLVSLKNGKAYSFLAATPDFIKQTMADENAKSFLSPGLVLVSEISVESILSVVEHWLALAANNYIPLEHFGVLQKRISTKRMTSDPSAWVDPLESILQNRHDSGDQ